MVCTSSTRIPHVVLVFNIKLVFIQAKFWECLNCNDNFLHQSSSLMVHWCLIKDFLYPVVLEFLIEILLLFYLLTVRVPPCESENIPILQENQPYTDWKQKLWTAVECSQSLGFDHIPWSSSVNGMYSGVTRTEPWSPDNRWSMALDTNGLFFQPSTDNWSMTFYPLKIWLNPLANAS